jgi:predicted PurR-regulated permease PerM
MCVAFIVLYLFGAVPGNENPYKDLVLGGFTFLTALLPTVGAALGAIYAQGDFKTVAEQSRRDR